MTQPEGFEVSGSAGTTIKLQRSIYGLKKASRSWNTRFDTTVKDFGFVQTRMIHAFIVGTTNGFLNSSYYTWMPFLSWEATLRC